MGRMSPAGGGAGGGFVFSISDFTIKYFAKKRNEITDKVLNVKSRGFILRIPVQMRGNVRNDIFRAFTPYYIRA